MTVALMLLGYALALMLIAGPLLQGAAWADRAPRLAIAAWQALTFTVLASVSLAGLALTVPTVDVSGSLADLLEACVLAIREQYATPGGAAAGAAGLVLAAAVVGRTAFCLTAGASRVSRERGDHRRALDLVGDVGPRGGVLILESEEAAVYCLPGRRERTVVTTGALAVLDDEQLEAALAHERAHLVERHDLVLLLSSALAAAFPRLALFRNAASETARLLELRADDVAGNNTGRLTVASALLALVSTGTANVIPRVALAAAGSGAAGRVRRLILPRTPLPRLKTASAAAAVAAAVLAPLLFIGGPAVGAVQHNLCPDFGISSIA